MKTLTRTSLKFRNGKLTLFRNKRFALNEMFQQNASKFAILYVGIRKPM